MIGRARAYRAQAIRDLFSRLFGWIRRRAAVARLQPLDDRMLKDIGIYRGEIETAVRGSGAAGRATQGGFDSGFRPRITVRRLAGRLTML